MMKHLLNTMSVTEATVAYGCACSKLGPYNRLIVFTCGQLIHDL